MVSVRTLGVVNIILFLLAGHKIRPDYSLVTAYNRISMDNPAGRWIRHNRTQQRLPENMDDAVTDSNNN